MFRRILAAAGLASALLTGAAQAADPIKIGVLYAFSGPNAAAGKQIETALKVFQQEHGTTAGGREVQFILRDTTGPAPDVATRLATELITRDKVDLITGIDFTPNAMAVAALSNRAKIPVISMNASGLAFLKEAKYGARFSFTLPQQSVPMATWAAANGVKTVYTLVADFGPGLEAEKAFTEEFKAKGGEIAGSVRVPLSNPDFAPYMQRIREAKPDAVFVFLPSGGGDLPTLFFRGFHDAGLAGDGIRILGTGETDELTLDSIGDIALGVITAQHYSAAHDSPENKAFVAAFEKEAGGKLRPSFAAAAAYDTMGALYAAFDQLGGKITADGLLDAIRGKSYQGLRGPFSIGKDGEITQSMYIREVRRVNGELENIEFEEIPNVPGAGH